MPVYFAGINALSRRAATTSGPDGRLRCRNAGTHAKLRASSPLRRFKHRRIARRNARPCPGTAHIRRVRPAAGRCIIVTFMIRHTLPPCWLAGSADVHAIATDKAICPAWPPVPQCSVGRLSRLRGADVIPEICRLQYFSIPGGPAAADCFLHGSRLTAAAVLFKPGLCPQSISEVLAYSIRTRHSINSYVMM